MISKCLMTTLLLLVDVALLECLDITEKCDFIPASLDNTTVHYLLGDKIQLELWCTTTDRFIGDTQDRFVKFSTSRTHYQFYERRDDPNKGFTLDFDLVNMTEVTPDGYTMFNATTTLTIDPALMLYDNERIFGRMIVRTGAYTIGFLNYVDLDIVQLKNESHNVIVPNTCPNVTLFCELEYPVVPQRQPIYVWKKVEGDRRKALQNSDTYVIGNDGTLIINPLPTKDQDFYECSLHFIEDTDEVTAQRRPSRIKLTLTEPKEGEEKPECHILPPTTESTTVTTKIEGIEYVDFALLGVLILGSISVTAAALYRINKVPTPSRIL